MGPAFADLPTRGLIVGLWMTAFQAHATATGNIVTMTHADLCWVTCRQRPEVAAKMLAKACARVGYRVWFHGRTEPVPSWHQLRTELARSPCEPGAEPVPVPSSFGAVSVHVRNLAKKQLWHSTKRGGDSTDSDASELRTPPSDLRSPKEEGEAAASRVSSPNTNGLSEEVLEEVAQAFKAYGKTVRSWPDSRRRALRARLREHGGDPAVLASAVHGYAYYHRGKNYRSFDPLSHLTPETIFRATNFPKYLDAAHAAVRAGHQPPFSLGPETAMARAERIAKEIVNGRA